MYRLYLEKYEPAVAEKGDSPEVKEWLYWKIFNEEFNIGFGYPHSDTCEKCDLLKLAVDNAQTENECSELQAELAAHQGKAAQGYGALCSDSENSKAKTNMNSIFPDRTWDLA